METPEVHRPHVGHGAGLPRWLELLIAVTALVTSISSIVLALQHGRIMEKLVEANSIPYLQAGFSDVTPEGDQVLSLDLLNRGVGPAHQKSLRVRVGGRYVRSVAELIAASIGPEQAAAAQSALNPVHDGVRTRFIPGGQSQMVFRARRTAENARYFDQLDKAQPQWSAAFCYCSVFDECWEVLGKSQEPQRVKQCRRDEAREFAP